LVSLVAGILVLIFPRFGFLIVVYIFAFAMILLGTERLGMGITGHAYTFKKPEPEKSNTP
jgi:uncharacterized membrane protein HdeD (DUF308 family)